MRISTFFLLAVCLMTALSGCASRQVQDSLAGSTAQRLVTYSIDDLMDGLPADDFQPLAGKRVWLESHFVEQSALKNYADQRLRMALAERFGIEIATTPLSSDVTLQVFYTSLGTDQELAGFYLPLGAVPGVDNDTRVNLITLEKFHGISELYYFVIDKEGITRGPTLISRTRTDALGLPIITIPISRLPGDRP